MIDDSMIINDNEFSVFKLPEAGGSLRRAQLRARALPLVRLKDQNSRRSSAPRRQVQAMLPRMPKKHDNAEHPKSGEEAGGGAAVREHGEFLAQRGLVRAAAQRGGRGEAEREQAEEDVVH